MANTKKTVSFKMDEEKWMRLRELIGGSFTENAGLQILQAVEDAAVDNVNDKEVAELQAKLDSRNKFITSLKECLQVDTDVTYSQILEDIKTKTNCVKTAEVVHTELLYDIDKLKKEVEKLELELSEKDAKLLHADKNVWKKAIDTLEPLPKKLLVLTAKRLSEKYNKEVKPQQILIDMFTRYSIERWNQWFYPFVITENEILEIAQAIDPNITDYKQLHFKK